MESLSISNVERITRDRFTFDVDVPTGADTITLRGLLLAWSPGRWLVHSPYARLASGGGQVEVIGTTPATKKLLRDLVLAYLADL